MTSKSRVETAKMFTLFLLHQPPGPPPLNCSALFEGFKITVKPVHNNHIWDPKKWPLLTGGRLCFISS